MEGQEACALFEGFRPKPWHMLEPAACLRNGPFASRSAPMFFCKPLGNAGNAAALCFVGEIDPLKPRPAAGGFYLRFERVIKLALLADAVEDRRVPLFQRAQTGANRGYRSRHANFKPDGSLNSSQSAATRFQEPASMPVICGLQRLVEIF
jgi:hypothetical protein